MNFIGSNLFSHKKHMKQKKIIVFQIKKALVSARSEEPELHYRKTSLCRVLINLSIVFSTLRRKNTKGLLRLKNNISHHVPCEI